MTKKVKVGLQLLGLAAWTTAWLGSGWVILNKLFPKENNERTKRKRDR